MLQRKCIQILEPESARPVVQSKVENSIFYFGEVIWVTGLSGAFGYSHVFLSIFTIDKNELH